MARPVRHSPVRVVRVLVSLHTEAWLITACCWRRTTLCHPAPNLSIEDPASPSRSRLEQSCRRAGEGGCGRDAHLELRAFGFRKWCMIVTEQRCSDIRPRRNLNTSAADELSLSAAGYIILSGSTITQAGLNSRQVAAKSNGPVLSLALQILKSGGASASLRKVASRRARVSIWASPFSWSMYRTRPCRTVRPKNGKPAATHIPAWYSKGLFPSPESPTIIVIAC